MKIGIVIVNYKDYANKYLEDCVTSLRKQNWEGNTQLFIVDNASTPESQDYLKKHTSEAKILPRKDGNYSSANKLGIENALKENCDYIVITNMDVIFCLLKLFLLQVL